MLKNLVIINFSHRK